MKERKNIIMKCNVCGNEDFEYDNEKYRNIEEAESLKCILCNKVYSREELIMANTLNINNAAEEVAKDLLEKAFKKNGFKLK